MKMFHMIILKWTVILQSKFFIYQKQPPFCIMQLQRHEYWICITLLWVIFYINWLIVNDIWEIEYLILTFCPKFLNNFENQFYRSLKFLFILLNISYTSTAKEKHSYFNIKITRAVSLLSVKHPVTWLQCCFSHKHSYWHSMP